MVDLEDLRKICADAIDTDWHYSWHWGESPKDRHWTMDALIDYKEEIVSCQRRISRLISVYTQLEEIAPRYYPETEQEVRK